MNNLPESQLIQIWQHQSLERTGLVTEEGEPIEIIYPGRRNDGRGGDFRDAVLATSRGLIKGDIEVHVRSSGWQEHQHHQDAAYNRVVLQVVMWHDTDRAANLQNGRAVPILALDKYVKTPVSRSPDLAALAATLNIPCFKAGERLKRRMMAGFLDRAGEERFFAKAARFQADLPQVGASQSLYQGLMGALGYAKNKLPFLELAGRLPLPVLEATTKGGVSDVECLARQQALLLGTAGLLPSQPQDRRERGKIDETWVDNLERLWASSEHTGAMSPHDWHLFKVRPSNSPIRRLAAMSYLILCYRREGLLKGLVSLVKEVPAGAGHRTLEEGLLVTADGFWSSHSDFGSGSGVGSPTLLGRGRAADMVINVLLPFIFAWSQSTAQPEIEKKAFDLYRHYPRLAVNSVEKHMVAQLGLSRCLVNSARRQQGLIHIYNTLCTQGRCADCSLSQT